MSAVQFLMNGNIYPWGHRARDFKRGLEKRLKGLKSGFNCSYSEHCLKNPLYDEIISILQTNCGSDRFYSDNTLVPINNSANT